MKENLGKVYKYLLFFVFVITLMPLTVLAAHQTSGKPSNLEDPVYLAIYNGDGFPGEPAVYGTSLYTNFNSNFQERGYVEFASNAKELLDESIIDELIQGAPNGSQNVWGVYNTTGIKNYFLQNSSIVKPENELKIIKAIKGNNATSDEYEIIWYVIKYQSNNRHNYADDWHIDGIIKEKDTYSVNYYGNGNTSGDAPLGVTGILPGGSYKVVGNTGNLVKNIGGVNYEFLGWSTNSKAESAEYVAGDEIKNINRNISLYAVWDTHIEYPVTVFTYLNDASKDIDDINDANNIYLKKKDTDNYILLDKIALGTYSTDVKNGTYDIYLKINGNYQEIKDGEIIVENDKEEIKLHYYSVDYDTNGGSFKQNENPGVVNYFTGSKVVATSNIPVRDGYIFKGWKYNNTTISIGKEVTNSISSKITLKAEWEKAVNVTINVTIDHRNGNSFDASDDKDELIVELLRRTDKNSPYIETNDKIEFKKEGVFGYDYNPTHDNNSVVVVTKYDATKATFTNLSSGYEYTALTSKSHYDVKEIKVTQDKDGNWIIDIELQYNPDDFNINFSVAMDKDVPKKLYPKAAIVKVAVWNNDEKTWEIIDQQKGNLPGVRVNISKDTGIGTGSYPVLKYVSNNKPYGYRIVVTAFVYEDGTIVSTSENISGLIATYEDGNYKAITGKVKDGEKYGKLYGAYYNSSTSSQKGTLDALITVEKYNVTFDAMGGSVKGKSTYTEKSIYQIPEFDDYVPTRDKYKFLGWYLDKNYKTKAIEKEFLTDDITLYAKWSPIQTITGNVKLNAKYELGGQTITIWSSDRPTKATVVLQELIDGHVHAIDSQIVYIVWDNDNIGTSSMYKFENLDGEKTYRIDVLLENYTNYYQNETTIVTDNQILDDDYNSNDYEAVFEKNPVATFVNAYLKFEAENYWQGIEIDSSAIGVGYRPTNSLASIIYKLAGQYDDQYKVISQHTISPNGIIMDINSNGFNSTNYGEYVWKTYWDGTLYVYQANLLNLTINQNKIENNDNAPFTVIYGQEAGWNPHNNAASGLLNIVVIPNIYNIYFDLNTSDTVTGMDTYFINGIYKDTYTWSFGKDITANPERVGYIFEYWMDAAGNKVTKIEASLHEDVTLYAKWKKDETQTKDIKYKVEHNVDGTIKDTKEYTVKVWINADDEVEILQDSLKENLYNGYKFVGVKDAIKEGDIVKNDTVITLNYEKDEFKYTILYYYDDKLDNSLTEELKAIYQSTITNYEDKIKEGYILEKVDGLPLQISYEIEKNIIKVYYLTDNVGGGIDGNESDNIPDKYQKKLTFKIINGIWNTTLTNNDIIMYVTLLDEDGNYSLDGRATIIVPNDMKPLKGYNNGKWDVMPGTVVSGLNDETYTYSYDKIVVSVTNPSTFDNIISWICLLFISLMGIIAIVIYKKKENQKNA